MLFVNMALGSLILIVLSKFSEEWLAKILSDISCVGVSFLLVRYVVFKDSKK
jgi:putative flippase GtrA